MNYYLLSLYVTFEQEQAIRELFIVKGWDLVKCESTGHGDSFGSCKRLTSIISNTEDEIVLDTHKRSLRNENILDYAKDPENNNRIEEESEYSSSHVENIVYKNFKVRSLSTLSKNKENKDQTSHSSKQSVLEEPDNPTDIGKPSPLDMNDDEGEDSDDTIIDYADQDSSVKLLLSHVKQEEKEFQSSHGKFHARSAESTDLTGKLVMKVKSDSFRKSLKTQRSASKVKKKIYHSEKKSRTYKSFYCKDCKCTYKLLGQFKRHKRFGKCVFDCQLCDKIFTSRHYSSYLLHLKRHRDERPHKCKICNKAFNFPRGLEQHMKTHSNPREFICQHCGKEFLTARNLYVHCQTMHNKDRKFFKCDICNSLLSSLGSLKVHKRDFHSNEKPYVCEICGKSFKSLRTLQKSHSVVHTEDLPFACSFSGCDKKFKRSGGLAKHMQRHYNDRRFPCDTCDMRFYSNGDLLKHYRTHTGEKPFKCSHCEYCCALPGNLRKHMKTHKS